MGMQQPPRSGTGLTARERSHLITWIRESALACMEARVKLGDRAQLVDDFVTSLLTTVKIIQNRARPHPLPCDDQSAIIKKRIDDLALFVSRNGTDNEATNKVLNFNRVVFDLAKTANPTPAQIRNSCDNIKNSVNDILLFLKIHVPRHVDWI